MSNTYKLSTLLVLLAVVTMMTACKEEKKGGRLMSSNEQISPAEWQAVTQKKIIFGHQSVGNNILSGVKALTAQAGINLKFIESRSAATEAGITHFKIGKNEDPESKIKDFEETLVNGLAKGADIALVKLCYVDITANTDAKKLAQDYIASLDRLSIKFPSTAFIAVTAPLTTVQSGPKVFIKRLLGREPGGFAANFKRQEFNTILRSRYGQKGSLFDLAKIESEGAGNYQFNGQPIEVMNPAFTDDGGHLNATGEKIVASKLLKFIVSNSSRP